jgi:hypothetical protein
MISEGSDKEEVMRQMMVWAVVAVVALGILQGHAQEKEKEDAKSAPAASAQSRQPLHFYRLDFTFRELQDKKTVNSRSYTMLLADNGVMSILKSGARIPVPTGNTGQYQYIDVGVNLKCRVRGENEPPLLVATIDFTSPVVPEQGGAAATGMVKEQPVLRQANADVYAPIVTGKPLVIATMDDPSLPRRFEIEVTPTRLK